MTAPTKDPHIAYIDAHEKLAQIRMAMRTVIETLQKKMAQGYQLTDDDKREIAAFRQKVIDATRRVQDTFLEEIEAHGDLQ